MFFQELQDVHSEIQKKIIKNNKLKNEEKQNKNKSKVRNAVSSQSSHIAASSREWAA
jgi:hypothetical protein